MTIGVLLVNSGTPASTQVRDVRRFLSAFLADPRVVELPRALWLPILHGFVLRTRPKASAKKYRKIWMPEEVSALGLLTGVACRARVAPRGQGWRSSRRARHAVQQAQRKRRDRVARQRRRGPRPGAAFVSAIFQRRNRLGLRCGCGGFQNPPRRARRALRSELLRAHGFHRRMARRHRVYVA